MEDAALMARLAAGDPSAIGQLYDRYGRQVYSLAYRMTGDPAAAEDVTQDVFLKVWRSAARFDPDRGRAATWILHIAHTTTVDSMRARGRTTPSRFEDDTDEPDHTANTAEQAEVAVLGAQVRSALMRLPAEQRQAVELAYFGAMSQTEIAGHLRIPLGTVKSRVRLALDSLRLLLLSPRGKEVPNNAGLPSR